MNTIPPRSTDSLVFHDELPYMQVLPSGDNPEHVDPSQQDLLEASIEFFAHPTAIPLQNRMRYLMSDQEQEAYNGHRFIDLDELANKLNATPEELGDIVIELHVPSNMIRYNKKNEQPAVASVLEVVIAEEYAWRQTYEELDQEVTTRVIADIFGTTHGAMTKRLKTTGIRPRVSRDRDGDRHYYPKSLLHRVRAELMIFPPARDNKTIFQMIGNIGCSHGWAESHADEAFAPDLMRSPLGPVLNHYDPRTEQYLDRTYHAPPEAIGTLRNVTQIAYELDRATTWVAPRLRKFRKSQFVSGRGGVEYDETVFQALFEQSELERTTPLMADDEVILKVLVEPLDTTQETASRVIKERGFTELKRRTPTSTRIISAYKISLREPLARAIIEDREYHIKLYEKTVSELSLVPKEALNTDERKRLLTSKRLLPIARKDLARALAAYENLLKDTPDSPS